MFNFCKKKVFCEKHKKYYRALEVNFGGSRQVEPCPECIAERPKRMEEKNGAKKFHELFCRRGRIPPRHMHCTFDNYIAKSKAQIHAKKTTETYAKDILENKAYSLILSGGVGTGKNHLASSIAINLLKKSRSAQIWSAKSIVDCIRDTYKTQSEKTTRQVVDELKSLHLLIIDEIVGYDEKEVKLLFDIMNERYLQLRPTVIISNLDAMDLKKAIGEPAFDRMREGGGKFVSFNWGSYR